MLPLLYMEQSEYGVHTQVEAKRILYWDMVVEHTTLINRTGQYDITLTYDTVELITFVWCFPRDNIYIKIISQGVGNVRFCLLSSPGKDQWNEGKYAISVLNILSISLCLALTGLDIRGTSDFVIASILCSWVNCSLFALSITFFKYEAEEVMGESVWTLLWLNKMVWRNRSHASK